MSFSHFQQSLTSNEASDPNQKSKVQVKTNALTIGHPLKIARCAKRNDFFVQRILTDGHPLW